MAYVTARFPRLQPAAQLADAVEASDSRRVPSGWLAARFLVRASHRCGRHDGRRKIAWGEVISAALQGALDSDDPLFALAAVHQATRPLAARYPAAEFDARKIVAALQPDTERAAAADGAVAGTAWSTLDAKVADMVRAADRCTRGA